MKRFRPPRLLLAAAVLSLAGCAGFGRQAELHGPAVPTPGQRVTAILTETGAPPPAPPETAPDAARLDRFMVELHSMMGVPYRWGGVDAKRGLDCSGLVKVAFRRVGVFMPRTAAQQARVGARVAKSDLQPGDLVFFNTRNRDFSHVGVYVGEGTFLHAPRTGARVRYDRLAQPYWAQRYQGARRPFGFESERIALELVRAGAPRAEASSWGAPAGCLPAAKPSPVTTVRVAKAGKGVKPVKAAKAPKAATASKAAG